MVSFCCCSATFRAHFGHISGTFRAHFGYISDTFRVHFGHISGTFRAHFGHHFGPHFGPRKLWSHFGLILVHISVHLLVLNLLLKVGLRGAPGGLGGSGGALGARGAVSSPFGPPKASKGIPLPPHNSKNQQVYWCFVKRISFGGRYPWGTLVKSRVAI